MFVPGAKAKVAVVTVAAWQGWEQTAHSIFVEIAVVAAGVVGAGVLWKKVIVPMWAVLAKLNAIHDAVRGLPQWQAAMEKRMEDGAEHFELVDGQLRLLMSNERLRIDDAISQAGEAGDPSDGT